MTTRSKRMAEARKRGTHTKEQWRALRDEFGTCVRCLVIGRHCPYVNLERDHIVPVYQGGSDSIDNVQPVCALCNAQKGSEAVDYRPEARRILAARGR